MLIREKRLLILLAAVCCLAGCDKIFPAKKKAGESKPASTVKTSSPLEAKGTVIAKVNNQPITLEELNSEIESYNKEVPPDQPNEKIDTRDKKIAYLKNEMVRRVILAQAAQDKGLDRKEDVVKALDNFRQSILVAELIRQETESVEVASKEIEDYYNASKEQLKEPEERQIREIVVAGESEAKDILIELLKGMDFTGLAQSRSTAASAQKGGDLGYIKKGVKSPKFDDMAFSPTLEVGKFSNYFKAAEGYYILKLEARREGKVKSLSELWDDIKTGLTFLKKQQKIEELISKLSSGAKIEIIESAVK